MNTNNSDSIKSPNNNINDDINNDSNNENENNQSNLDDKSTADEVNGSINIRISSENMSENDTSNDMAGSTEIVSMERNLSSVADSNPSALATPANQSVRNSREGSVSSEGHPKSTNASNIASPTPAQYPKSKHPFIHYPQDIFEIAKLSVSEQLDTITPEERNANQDYFRGSKSRNPEKYLVVRESIIKCWLLTPQNYLTKMGVHKVFQGLGCVNSVGRVHGYLERVGLVNIGIGKPGAKRTLKQFTTSDAGSSTGSRNDRPARDRRSTRRRTERNYNELSSRDTSPVYSPTAVSTARDSPAHPTTPTPSIFPPFHILPYKKFDTTNPQPFQLAFSSAAMGLMELHAQLTTNEVIGLMGGTYDTDTNLLTVSDYFPCLASMSNPTECEMDSSVEVVGKERLAEQGLIVVGWYHSHPTFPPNPSHRDCLTQAHHQLQYKTLVGDQPVELFVGLIVTPFAVPKPIDLFDEDINWDAVERERACYSMLPYGAPVRERSPHKMDYQLIPNDVTNPVDLNKVKQLTEHYRSELGPRLSDPGLNFGVDAVMDRIGAYFNGKHLDALRSVLEDAFISSVAFNGTNGDTNGTYIKEEQNGRHYSL